MKAWILAALLLAAPVMAGVTGESSRLGAGVDARPEDLIVFSDQIRMGARLVFDADEGLAIEVTKPVMLRLEVGFMTDKSATDQEVRLRCLIRFVAPDGSFGSYSKDRICYRGNLATTAGSWTLMPLNFRFRPELSDANGASGVWVQVTDEISGEVKVLMPTYGWMGGQG